MRTSTKLGDVLILHTETGVRIHAVGRVTRNGQEDFHAEPPPLYIVNREEAVAVAQTLVRPGGKIFLINLDKGDWSELAT
jgi:hypothetical protein